MYEYNLYKHFLKNPIIRKQNNCGIPPELLNGFTNYTLISKIGKEVRLLEIGIIQKGNLIRIDKPNEL
jgi:hypothetical protein